jgi:hypothetical protein
MLAKVNGMKSTLLLMAAISCLGAESRLVTGQFETTLLSANLTQRSRANATANL